MALATMAPVALGVLTGGPGHGAGPTCGIHCGTERWQVKTLSDAAASQVSLTPESMSVSKLVAIAAPTALLSNDRDKVETQAVTVDAELVGYKQEFSAGKGDHDFHIVIRDPSTKETMIVEIPDPQCDGVCNSIAGDRIKHARETFSTTFASNLPSSTFVAFKTPVKVTVVGVPLFDFHHGQTGVAKNCIEIHPVLDFSFPSGTPTEAPTPGTVPALPAADYNCIPE